MKTQKRLRRVVGSRADNLRKILSELCPLNTSIPTEQIRLPLQHLGYRISEIQLVREELNIVTTRAKGRGWVWTRLAEGAVAPESPILSPEPSSDLLALQQELRDYARQLRHIGADDETVVVALKNAAAVRLNLADIAAEKETR